MKAYQLVGWKKHPEFRDVPVPKPGPGEVLIKIAGAGACHSDLHLEEFDPGLLPYDLPFTLGHENAGWVETLGDGVKGFKKGDPVMVYGPWGCGHCHACQQGVETYCERAAELKNAGGGLGLNGGMAEYMLIPQARWLLPIPSNLDPRAAAPLADAGLTPYHAVKRSLPALHGPSTAVVIGAGGLGQMGLQFLKVLSGATVAVIDTADDKLETAKSLGADEVLKPGEAAEKRIRDMTRGQGADVVIDFVGANPTMATAAKIGKKQGMITIVGLGGGSLPFNFFGVPYESNLATTYWGTLPELTEVLTLAAAKKVRINTEFFKLDEAPKAYKLLREGKLRGRGVITPNG